VKRPPADALPLASSQVSAYVHLFRDGANVVPNLKAGSKGARFENAPTPETIGRDLHPSVRIQPPTDESEAGEKPIEPVRAR
jgi:hypothetical protein